VFAGEEKKKKFLLGKRGRGGRFEGKSSPFLPGKERKEAKVEKRGGGPSYSERLGPQGKKGSPAGGGGEKKGRAWRAFDDKGGKGRIS